MYYLAPLGFILSCARWTEANFFILLYAYTAYYFASKMSRLVILLGPVAAALGGEPPSCRQYEATAVLEAALSLLRVHSG